MIWLIGCRGMLGKELADVFAERGMAFEGTGSEIDITDKNALLSYASHKKFDWIVNCSAYTAVDKAESEEEKAMRINCDGVANIAEAASLYRSKIIHFSTDYVFSGESSAPYRETDETAPVSAYGRTKLAGEKVLISSSERYLIFRISWLYGRHGKNFVGTMLRLMDERTSIGVVNDQIGSPTCAMKLAENIASLIQADSEAFGTYHYSDEGIISWYDFALKIYELGHRYGILSKQTDIRPISTAEFPTPAKRPFRSVFDKTKIRSLGLFKLEGWDRNLENYIKRIACHA